MPRATLKVCAQPGCPNLTRKSRCDQHRKAQEQRRGTRQARGYDAEYDRERRRCEPLVAAGGVRCWRCGQPILPGSEWHLGHDDRDRSVIRGPEHARECNLWAAGLASHGISPDA